MNIVFFYMFNAKFVEIIEIMPDLLHRSLNNVD
jgi:hypothetical protein